MSGFLSLNHFCEQHGPQLLLTTQAFHHASLYAEDYISAGDAFFEEEQQQTSPPSPSCSQSHPSQQQREPPSPAGAGPSAAYAHDEDQFHTAPPSPVRHGALAEPASAASASVAAAPAPSTPLQAPAGAAHLQRTPQSSRTPSYGSQIGPQAPPQACGGCSWPVHGPPGFVTKDGGAVTQYISQQAPRRTEVYAVARRACVRSLSSELAPGREGPLLFGDTQHGYAFSYTFTLRDTRARGGLRHYSFTLVMADAVHLVGCWPFLTRQLHVLVRDLKLRAHSFAKEEVAAAKIHGNNDPQSSQRHADFHAQHQGRSTASLVSSSGGNPRNRRTKREQRTLAELVQHERIYADIHAYFTWVLRGCYSRLFERQLEGPSLVALPTPRQEIVGWDNLGRPSTFAALAQALNALGHDTFSSIASAVSIGDQCIVRCRYPEVAASVVSVLAQLVPMRCAVIELSPPNYVPPQLCNFLVLSDTDAVPGEEQATLLPGPADDILDPGAASPAASSPARDKRQENISNDVVDRVAAAAEARVAAILARAAEEAAIKDDTGGAQASGELASVQTGDSGTTSTSSSDVPSATVRGSAGKFEALERIVLLDVSLAGQRGEPSSPPPGDAHGSSAARPPLDPAVDDEDPAAWRAASPTSSVDPLDVTGGLVEDAEAASQPPAGVSITAKVIGGARHEPNSYARTITGFLLRTHNELVQDHLLLTLRERWMHMAKAFFRFRRTLAHTDEAKADQSFAQGFGIQLDDLAVLRFWAQGLSRAHRIKLLQKPREDFV